MRILLQDLHANHPKLRLVPIDYHSFGALAMQRAGHDSPKETSVKGNASKHSASVEWLHDNRDALMAVDEKDVTEYGAEAVALGYAHASDGWVVKRRLQQGESADWLMTRDRADLAMEVSGVAIGYGAARLTSKIEQVGRCKLPVERLAIVIDFEYPAILVGRP